MNDFWADLALMFAAYYLGTQRFFGPRIKSNRNNEKTPKQPPMTLIQKIAGCSKGRVWRGSWGEFDLEKPYASLRWRAMNRWEWLKQRPRVYRWRIANVLCRMAHRLRGHQTHEGWYGIKCNESEILRQSIEEHLIPTGDPSNPPPLMIDPEYAEEMRKNLDRLAALARATFWHDK